MNYAELCQTDINIDRIKAVLDLTYAPGWSHTFSSRSNPGLYYIMSGSMDICINSTPYQLNPGTIVAFSDMDNVKMNNNSDEDLSTIQLTFYSADKFLFSHYGISHVSHDNIEKKYLKYFKQALQLFTQKPIAYKIGIRSILEQIIRRLIMDSFFESVNLQSSKSQKLVILQKYLDENYAMPIGISDMCSISNYSPSRLRAIFKEELNSSPVQYLQNIRLKHAELFLTETDVSINYIAAKVGYANTTYFCRLFRAIYHMTPSEYRQLYGAQQI